MHTADGAALALEPVGPQRWRVAHARGARLVVEARLPENDASRRAGWDSSDSYRPIVEPGLFQAIGHLALPLPQHVDLDRALALTVAYEGFAEAGWEVVDSFGRGPGPRAAAPTAGELRGALFVAGDLELAEPAACPGARRRARAHRARRLRARGGGGWAPDLAGVAALPALAGRVIAAERELMRDPGPPHYLVSALPVGEPMERGSAFGGTGLTNGFALYLMPNLDVEREGLEVLRLVAHECFHAWNGLTLRLDGPEEQSYWFSEGFTDWAAREVLRRAGWLDDAAYAADLSQRLRDYHASAWRETPAEELAEAFWTDYAAQRQPYLRGDVVAMRVDHALRDASGGADELFALLRALVDEARATGRRFDTPALLDRLEARVAAHAGAERARALRATLRAVVVDGATVELPADAFGPRFAVEAAEAYAWDPGFDLDATVASRVATGVRADGPAARAGLAEGMALVGMSLMPGEAEHEVELRVQDGDAVRELRYLPRGAASRVPAVRCVEG
ncbi:MAG: hypothetical protein H6828_00515 [Planctomycetes bacterium]|nr:hypothetical protein [Planctomycetota bacterium]